MLWKLLQKRERDWYQDQGVCKIRPLMDATLPWKVSMSSQPTSQQQSSFDDRTWNSCVVRSLSDIYCPTFVSFLGLLWCFYVLIEWCNKFNYQSCIHTLSLKKNKKKFSEIRSKVLDKRLKIFWRQTLKFWRIWMKLSWKILSTSRKTS